MNELQEIIKAYDHAKVSKQACVLATVVHLEGSSYRRPGARMLVLEDGTMIGAISGGCLEGDALKKAFLTFTEKKTKLVTYDTRDEEDAQVGVQLGCEGIIHVLFEYIHPNISHNPIELFRVTIADRRQAVVVTLFNLSDKKNNQPGTCVLQTSDGIFISSINKEDECKLLQQGIQDTFQKGHAQFKQYTPEDSLANAFYDLIHPPVSLVIVGAGNDAIPLMQMATLLGWEVKVVDGRQTHAKPDRFSSACQILVSKPETVLAQMIVDLKTCFVLMTHNYQYDLQMLKALLQTQVPYIGVLGPKKKLNKMLGDFQQQGIVVTEEMLTRIYGPTGLDIGAETPQEIASSIIAEIQAAMNHKNGAMLKWKETEIHST